jgi:biofilm PGA synthesis N-glycosyltransferase PgaC
MRMKDTEPYRYVLITPARNEATFIRKTLDAMVVQTVLPVRWVIVSDGSTDGTDEIVKEYAAKHGWIELVHIPDRNERHFGGKVDAFNAGYAKVRDLKYDVVGNLDGDSSFDPDYIEYLLDQFAQNTRLGVAGTTYWESSWEKSLKHDYRFANPADVSGLCQLFRRECFEAFGGYTPSKQGGVDLVASLKARMCGWETRTFADKFAVHHRQQGTADSHKVMVEFYNGRKDYMFGGHPVWEIFRAMYRLTRKPYVIGGCLVFSGYLWAMATGLEKIVSPDIVEFRRKEQMSRLRNLFRRMVPRPYQRSIPETYDAQQS